MQQFLLTNLAATPGSRRFRIPLDILSSGLREISDFPYEPGEATWNGPTMVIRGTNSESAIEFPSWLNLLLSDLGGKIFIFKQLCH